MWKKIGNNRIAVDGDGRAHHHIIRVMGGWFVNVRRGKLSRRRREFVRLADAKAYCEGRAA